MASKIYLLFSKWKALGIDFNPQGFFSFLSGNFNKTEEKKFI